MNGALIFTSNCVKTRPIVVAYFVLSHIASIVTVINTNGFPEWREKKGNRQNGDEFRNGVEI